MDTIQDFEFIGGDIALDFANTGAPGEPESERLRAWDDVLTFAMRAGLLGSRRAEDLRELAAREPDAAGAVLERAQRLRDTLHRLFTSVASTGRPREEDVEALNSYLEEGMRFRRLEPDDRCCGWTWSAGDEPLAQMLWPIANAAAELLVDGELERVKQCGNDACAWLFVDSSRNRSRRWCDMKECGNRAKARRHYARRKDSPDAAP